MSDTRGFTQRVVLSIIIIVVIYLLLNYYSTSHPINRPNYRSDPQTAPHRATKLELVDTESYDDTVSSLDSSSGAEFNDSPNAIENFEASGIGNPVINQGTWENSYALMSLPLTNGGGDTMSDRLIPTQIKTSEFLKLNNKLKTIIGDIVIKYASTCQEMNGSEVGLGDDKTTLTLACVTDPFAIQEEIIYEIYDYLYKYTFDKFNVHLNPYMAYHDLYQNLNLMEGLIYPISNSGLYTVHGIQYTTARWIRNKVNDIEVRHAVMTIFSRRGIEIQLDTDQQTY